VRAVWTLALLPLAASAQDTARTIVFHGDLGYVATSGNTQVSTINFADQLTLRTSPVNKIDQTFSVVYGQNKNVVQTNIWTVALRDEYAFTKQIGLYGLGQFDRNTFAGVDYNFEEGGGFAVTPVLPKRHRLEIDAGIAYVEQKLLPDSIDHHAVARGAITYRYTFGKDTYAQEAIEGLPDLHDEKDFRVNSETDLVAPLSRHLALKLGYAIRYANLPPPGFKTTDRLFTSDLQASF
jgi:putative salt-induced outer membrane protein YdiY